jgi:hypothetical protein
MDSQNQSKQSQPLELRTFWEGTHILSRRLAPRNVATDVLQHINLKIPEMEAFTLSDIVIEQLPTPGGKAPVQKRNLEFYQNLACARNIPWQGVRKVDLIKMLKTVKAK